MNSIIIKEKNKITWNSNIDELTTSQISYLITEIDKTIGYLLQELKKNEK